MIEPRIPPRWKPGDSIALAAPSFFYDPARIQAGLEILEGWGFQPKLPPGLESREGPFAGSDEHRARTLNGALEDPDLSGVLCARGGYGAMRLLPGLPYEALRFRPKLLVGFSDITALSLALFARLGLYSLHGPMVGTLSWDAESSERLLRVLLGEPPGRMLLPEPVVISPGRATGRILGGNLCLIAGLVGTPYLPSLEGAILYLEEVDERPYRIDRMLTQLELAGQLDGLAGVLLGDFGGCVDATYTSHSWQEVVAARLGRRGIPVLAGFPGGHSRANWPVLIGARATLDADEGYLEIEEHLR